MKIFQVKQILTNDYDKVSNINDIYALVALLIGVTCVMSDSCCTFLYWCGTAAIISTSLGCDDKPYLEDVFVFTLKQTWSKHVNVLLRFLELGKSEYISFLIDMKSYIYHKWALVDVFQVLDMIFDLSKSRYDGFSR